MKVSINSKVLEEYTTYLYNEERSANTIAKYLRDIKAFITYMGRSKLSKELVLKWKEKLVSDYAPASVNSMLAAINSFFVWLDIPHCKAKPLKIQRTVFTKPEKELTHEEYVRLVKAAERENNQRLSLLLQTIGATGIRVSELKFITVEAINIGCATVNCKGKTRTVFIPNNLCRMLKNYCKRQKISDGIIFRTRTGAALDRSNIWKDMKALCESAGVAPGKVFPHNLRHLFARCYYQVEKDLSRLADILGHSSVNTTRIYMAESGQTHEKQLDNMKMILGKTYYETYISE